MPIASLRRELAAVNATCAEWATLSEDLYYKWCHERKLRRAAEEQVSRLYKQLLDLTNKTVNPPLLLLNRDNNLVTGNLVIRYKKLFGRLYWKRLP